MAHRLATITRHLAPTSPAGGSTDGLREGHTGVAATQTSAYAKESVVIVAYCRTAIGGFQGALSSFTAPQLGSLVIKEAVKRAGIEPSAVEEVFFGNVLTANEGQAPARQAALGAGLHNRTPCTTINKVCASGMKAAMFGAQQIQLGLASIVVAGGMESMSNAPYYLSKARGGYRMGNGELVDGMIKDGLWDPYGNHHMGIAAEKCADLYTISRKDQDEYATSSYKRAAESASVMKSEIVPVKIPGARGQPEKTFDQDEEVKNTNVSKLPSLSAAFKKDGCVTAGNSSTISDGAAALVLMSERKAKELGCKPLARVISYADAAQEPVMFTTAPALAIPKALERANLKISDIDCWEINEAFSVVAIANMKILGLDHSKVNVFGGAVSLGHPIGCSGARIIGTLITALQNKNGRFGCAAICNGGGGASAIIVERL